MKLACGTGGLAARADRENEREARGEKNPADFLVRSFSRFARALANPPVPQAT